MSTIKESIIKSLQRAFLTFQTFPVVLASALGFTLVTLVRIWMDWPQQEPYNFLFNCLHLAFSMSAIFGLAAIAMVQERYNEKKIFLAANLAGAAAGIIAFLLLYFLGGAEPRISDSVVLRVSELAAARISVALMVSFIGFIYFAGKPKDESDFARSLFMTQKAFLIAAIYGGVMMSGTSGIAGAIQALLYRNMTSKVYMVLGALIGFVAFAIFVGYFPDFRRGQKDSHREVAQKQPRFIEVLFEYIMVPIVLVLTVVLFSWAGKTIATGDWSSFTRLSGIVISYSIGGIWLHMMVTRRESGIATFYRKIYPIALLVILAFGLWAFVIQLNKEGLKTQEYYFALVWLTAGVSAVFLILMKAKAHSKIAAAICVAAVIGVLPFMGYHVLPVKAQVSRLENMLINEGILENDQLIPVVVEPDQEVRESITDAVNFLAYEEGAKLPIWFDERLAESDVFKRELGFAKTWPEPEYVDGRGDETLGTFLMLPNDAIDISEYDWAVYLREYAGDYDGEIAVTIDGEKGEYVINWAINHETGIPGLKILLDDRVIIDRDMKDYFDKTAEDFQSGQTKEIPDTYEPLSLRVDSPEMDVLLVFNHISITVDPREDIIRYYLELQVVYLDEK